MALLQHNENRLSTTIGRKALKYKGFSADRKTSLPESGGNSPCKGVSKNRRIIIKKSMLYPYSNTFIASPVNSEKAMVNRKYTIKRFAPVTILTAPRFVILVAGPVIIKADAAPRLMPELSHSWSNGTVPPPQA
jgi:hypothetical protein